MATSFKKTASVNALTYGATTFEDTRHWDNLEQPVIKKEFGHVTHIEFSPVKPYNFAVTSSARVQIYSSKSNELVRKLNQFTNAACSGSYRSDGKLLVGGDDSRIRIIDPTAKSLARSLSGHTDSVLVTKFLSDNHSVMSAGKDKTVRVWDIATQTEVHRFDDFKDYVKCGVTSSSSQDIFLTGSYDHTAKLFDRRTDSPVLSVDHGCPIESVLMFPSNGIFMTAGGTVVKIWDALAGGRQLSQLTHHHRTVMSLCFCSEHRHFMSAGSDRHIKVYDTSYQLVETLEYPASILSVAAAPDDSVLAVGMEGGCVSIEATEGNRRQQKTQKRKAPRAFSFNPQHDDLVVTTNKKTKLDSFEKKLKRFNHTGALDAALEPHTRQQTPEKTLGVITEIMRRGKLKPALAGHSSEQLQPMLKFIQKNICKPNYSILYAVLDILLDLYEKELETNAALQSAFRTIRETLQGENSHQMKLAEVKGALDMLFASSVET